MTSPHESTEASLILEKCEDIVRRQTRRINFSRYLQEFMGDPRISRRAWAYCLDAVTALGTQEDEPGRVQYIAFNDIELDDAEIDSFVRFLDQGSSGHATDHRILVLAGPPGTGIHAFVDRLVSVVTAYSRTDSGALYRIKDCPQNDDPLGLLGLGVTRQLVEEHRLEAMPDEPCEDCVDRLRFTRTTGAVDHGKLQGIAGVSVERCLVGVGRGIAVLRGADSTAASVERAAANASRGLMIVHDISDMAAGALDALVDVAKTPNLLIVGTAKISSLDTVAETDETAVYQARLLTVPVRHSLEWPAESDLYKRHTQVSLHASDRVHICPLTFEVAAKMAVLTRVQEAQTPDLPGGKFGKLELYAECPSNPVRVAEQGRCHDEGLFGIPPAAVLNALEGRLQLPHIDCISPFLVLDHMAKINGVDLEDAKAVADDCVMQARHTVRKASVVHFEAEAERLLDHYLDFLGSTAAMGVVYPDVNIALQKMEEPIHITNEDKDDFRSEVALFYHTNSAATWEDHPQIRRSIERRLLPPFSELRRELQKPRREQDRTGWRSLRASIHTRLRDEYGYCDACAVGLVRVATATGDQVRVKRSGLEWRQPLRFDLRDARVDLNEVQPG